MLVNFVSRALRLTQDKLGRARILRLLCAGGPRAAWCTHATMAASRTSAHVFPAGNSIFLSLCVYARMSMDRHACCIVAVVIFLTFQGNIGCHNAQLPVEE